MAYPFPSLPSLLQFSCTSKEYEKIIGKYLISSGFIRSFNVGDDYRRLIPWYVRSVCPFCNKTIQSPVDTYSLAGGTEYAYLLYGEAKDVPGYADSCRHFAAVRHFLNLHGNLPVEVTYFSRNSGEAPFIEDWCLSDDIESYVILHALPICRIEADQFVPAYTLFTLTYFSQDRERLVKRRSDDLFERFSGDPDYQPAMFSRASPEASAAHYYDLSMWAALGLLGYLDFTQADLPLRIGVDLQLPEIYRNIPGHRQPLTWSRNRGQFDYHPW